MPPLRKKKWVVGDATLQKNDTKDGGDGVIQIRHDLNRKLYLFEGPSWYLDVDAVVNSTSETLDRFSTGFKQAAGENELQTECQVAGSCKTGEAVSTRGCQLPAKRIIHTVAPRYCEKYAFAAQTALHFCYRNCLSIAHEEQLQSIAFPCLHSRKSNDCFPFESGSHVAIRTIRRFLEHFPDGLDRVFFCFDSDVAQMEAYEKLLALYFPRSSQELRISKAQLPQDLGNEFGEPVVEDRKIRIHSTIEPERSPPPNATDECVSKFSQMCVDPDKERLEKIKGTQVEYMNALRKARGMWGCDLEYYEGLDFVYHAGVDHNGDTVVALVFDRLPPLGGGSGASICDYTKAILYTVLVLDSLVNQPYSLVHLSSGPEKQSPPVGWISDLFSLFSAKYYDNLKAFYVVQPTTWLKMVFWAALPRRYYKKAIYFSHVSELGNVASRLRIPPAFFESSSSCTTVDDHHDQL